MADLEAIAALVEPEAKALGFDLVRVRWFANGTQEGDEPTLQVMAERPETGQLNIDDCSALSHRLSDLFDRLEEETGQHIAWKKVGSLRLAGSEARWSEIRRSMTQAKGFGVECHSLSAEEAAARFPFIVKEDG